jgi:putative colanic acid biosynthesis acetyltransferase WcaF
MNIDLTKSVSPFSKREKLRRLLWSYFVWPSVRFLPRRLGSRLRVAALRLFGARIGECCLIERGVQVWLPWQLELEGFVAIGRDVEIYNYGRVSVRRMTVISQYSYLCTGSHDYTHPHMPLIWRDIAIGSECWVAAGAFLGPGVEIGDGAVIGARSVVTKSMPARMICAGNPCKPIKPRNLRPEESINNEKH